MRAIQTSRKLLDRHPALRSADAAEIEHVILTTYGARRIDVIGQSSRLKVYSNYWKGAAIAICFGSNDGAEVEVRYSEASFFRQHFALIGTTNLRIGHRDYELSPTASCLVPAGQTLQLRFAPQLENLVFRIDRAFLAGKLGAIDGAPSLQLHIDPARRPNPLGAVRLEKLIHFLVSELDQEEPPPAMFVAEMEQALAVAFLSANPQLYRKAPTEKRMDVCCRQLRIAEDYIDAHWDQPLALETLTAITNISARSLFYYFRRWRGKTPMQYLKEVRLRHARQILQQSPAMTVTEVAFACGFGNLGHFAQDYLRAWGERPSDTRRGHSWRN